jgi:hypothetical protein
MDQEIRSELDSYFDLWRRLDLKNSTTQKETFLYRPRVVWKSK